MFPDSPTLVSFPDSNTPYEDGIGNKDRQTVGHRRLDTQATHKQMKDNERKAQCRRLDGQTYKHQEDMNE